ncbi:MAG: phenylalanine--tRNA ligase subunit beta [Ruminococcaceae bacterium]|nr:phenylalanine--tRNA ligase subunit beta [Oscillospiraceae bacterium]
MQLSMNWLADFTDVSDINIKDYCDRMTMTGSKVETYEVLAEDITGVVVGKILSVVPHSNSDHLVICQVEIGAAEPVQIVTGASNVFAGAVVPVATDGSNLPGGIKIKKGKLRGEVSCGMLCSIGELGLTTHDMPGAIEDGILILNDVGLADAPVGEDIRKVLMLADTAVEFEITSNRPDCLSVIGLARETAVSFGKELRIPEAPVPAVRGDGETIDKYLSVDIANTELCTRYSARVVKNVKIAPSPLWLRMRLRASGVRPINNIVDITNYVMLEYGQPMHAFDYKCLDGSHIIVRNAAEGETFVSLDDQEHTLDAASLVIADEKKAVALAGVMGGLNSEITDDTVTVVFESAMFHPGNVRVTAKKQGMRTESSARFEKGLDCENTMPALNRACELVALLNAGEVVDGTIDVYPAKKVPFTMELDCDKINTFLGVNLTREYMADVFRSLDFVVSEDLSTLTVPTYRDDVRCMNDLAEEVLRIYGYNMIESTLSAAATPTVGARTERQSFDMHLRDMLCGMGLDEIETFSFISPSYYQKIRLADNDVRRKSVVISNPLGEDTSVMRTTMLPSMLKVLSDNVAVKNKDVQLFEMGKVYLPTAEGELPEEPGRLSIGFVSEADKTGSGFYRMKGYLEAILYIAGITDADFVSCDNEPTFHPGRCAKLLKGDTELALFGEVHPEVAENYNFVTPVYVCELALDKLFDVRRLMMDYKPLPKYPALERDFSFVCDEATEAGTIAKEIKACGGKVVESVELFDIYRGAQIGEGKKSVSYAVMLRADDHTMTDEEADATVTKILDKLAAAHGITLRK